jgi:hypothetical protein
MITRNGGIRKPDLKAPALEIGLVGRIGNVAAGCAEAEMFTVQSSSP